MAEPLTEAGTSFSPWVGLIFVFNLIVGTGALTMPKAFQAAGWLISLIIIIFLALVSYVTATFVIEAMAAANGIIKYRRKDKKREDPPSSYQRDLGHGGPVEVKSASSSSARKSDTHTLSGSYGTYSSTLQLGDSSSSSSDCDPYTPDAENDEKERLLSGNPINYSSARAAKKHADYFEITELVDMGQMAALFFNRVGQMLFYICLIIYLYGDLAIYAVAVPKSLRNITCTYISQNNLSDSDPCWPGVSISRMNAYRLYLAVFGICLGVFVFFNVQKTKYLQIFTSLMRWAAFLTMIIAALVFISRGKSDAHPVAVGTFGSIPNFFGVCVYAFMCHHSLPSLVTPVTPKKRIVAFLFGDYMIILLFYLLLSITALLTFTNGAIQDIYTLNFFTDNGVLPFLPMQYFVALFPVFTLSTNFPIIGITLRNNLMALFLHENKLYPWAVRRLLFPTLVLVPPLAIAFATTNVTFLVGITGSYAGAGIQYLIPVFLVYYARKKTERTMGKRWVNHQHMSPFKHKVWLILIFMWAILCIAFVTVDHVLSGQ